ncbi:MAG: 2-oxo acid dehydrogenase subunit E2 [candidate division KSB1 bacterium]|nr:2-oxo acid dehydrogenase subunit E2 [candidate division KSB1 bacterium]
MRPRSKITAEIRAAQQQTLTERDIVLQRSSGFKEQLYYRLPGFIRRWIWKYFLKHPKTAYRNMGNVSVTSVGMMGRIKGWFIHSSVHPLSFGIGSVVRKPAVVKDGVMIRDILHMTLLIDHDVIDGAPMARFVKHLIRRIEKGQ